MKLISRSSVLLLAPIILSLLAYPAKAKNPGEADSTVFKDITIALITAVSTTTVGYFTLREKINAGNNALRADQDTKLDKVYNQFQEELRNALVKKEQELDQLRMTVLKAETERSALSARYEKAELEIQSLRSLNDQQNTEIGILKQKLKEIEEQKEQTINRMREEITKLSRELHDAIFLNDELKKKIADLEIDRIRYIDCFGDVETIIKLMEESTAKETLKLTLYKAFNRNVSNISTDQTDRTITT